MVNLNQPGSLGWWRQQVNEAAYVTSLKRQHPWIPSPHTAPADILKTMRARPADPARRPAARTTGQRRRVSLSATDARNLQTRVRQAQWALLHSGIEANQALARSLATWAAYLDELLAE